MAAPTLSISDIQGSLKNQMRAKQQKKKPKKMVLCSPYVNARSDLPLETQEKILQTLVGLVTPIAEEREEKRKQLKEQRMLKKERQRRNAVTDRTKESQVTEEGVSNQKEDTKNTMATGNNEVKPASNDQTTKTESPSDGQLNGRGDGERKTMTDRARLCFGINEVIKGLERDQMRLVLTCQSCKPEMLTQHLIGLAASRNCPATSISNLSTTLCPVLKISSLMALGIKKTQTAEISGLDEAVNFISGLIPVQSLPWIENESIEKEPITVLNRKSDKQEEISLVETKTTANQLDSLKTDSLGTQHNTADYSQFYVYKSGTSGVKSFGEDFIAFSKEEVTMDTIPDFGRKRKSEQESGGQAKFRKYQTNEYLPVFGNEKKVKRSKKKKNKRKV